MMRPLALLLLFAACASVASATDCPGSLHAADAADRRALARVGLAAFRTHMADYCHEMPEYVTEPAAFDAGITARCTSNDRTTTQFEVTFKNPCDRNRMHTVLMLVDTKPKDCPTAYDPKLAKWGWYTHFPGNMRPLECPTGFRKATRKDFPLLEAFLYEEFTQKSMPELKRRERRRPSYRFYCPAGIQTMDFSYINGCIQTWPKNVSKYVMAQGKVAYKCYESNTTRRLGLDGEGKYRTICQEKVSFSEV